jgi:hypothetical protein
MDAFREIAWFPGKVEIGSIGLLLLLHYTCT